VNHYYREVPGWFDSPGFYREMVCRCPDGGAIVEVGCWQGRSLACLLVEVVNSGKRIAVHGVDHWQGSAFEPKLIADAARIDLQAECRKNCERAGYPHWSLHSGESTAIAATMPPVDVVFIDASHDYDSVAADIRAWLPRVKPGGIIGGHDAYMPGVQQAYTELCGTVDVLEFCWWKELTVDNG
jgi:hypothetical protein